MKRISLDKIDIAKCHLINSIVTIKKELGENISFDLARLDKLPYERVSDILDSWAQTHYNKTIDSRLQKIAN